METATISAIWPFVVVAFVLWALTLALTYLIFLGSKSLSIRGFLGTFWVFAQEVARVGDRLTAIEKTLVEMTKKPEESGSIRINIPK